MNCDLCRRPEASIHLRAVHIQGVSPGLASACRRCRLEPHARPLWDALQLAEAAVIEFPDDAAVMSALRAARADFDLAVHGVSAPKKKRR